MYKKAIYFIGAVFFWFGISIGIKTIKNIVLDNHILVQAVKTNDVAQVKKLLSQGLSVNTINSDSLSILMEAILLGNIEMVQILLEHGADVEHNVNYNKLPPIVVAAFAELECKTKLKIMTLLLKHGANINFRNREGVHLLLAVIDSIAEGTNTIECFNFLLKHGIDVNLSDIKTGSTPLIYASGTDNLYIVKKLLQKGADVNVFDKNKETPLIRAVLKLNMDIIKELLAHGAHADIKDEFNQDLTLYPFLCGRFDIVNLLIAHGASFDKSILKKDKLLIKMRNLKDDSVEKFEADLKDLKHIKFL